MADIVIPLGTPLDIGDREVGEIALREPKARDYFELGEPIQYQRFKDGSKDGTYVAIDMDDVVAAYLKRLVKQPVMPEQLGNLTLDDAIAVKDRFLDFFRESQVRARTRAVN